MPQVLVVSTDSRKFPKGLRLGELAVSRYAGAAEASSSLLRQPTALVILDRLTADVHAIELLGALRVLRPSIPVLVLLPDVVDLQLPPGLHPCLRFAPSWLSPDRLLGELRSSLAHTACRPARTDLRLIDYLTVAVTLRQSLTLHVQHYSGSSAFFDLVDGNLWNAYCGDMEGETAMAAEALSSPVRVEAVRRHSLPANRQIFRPGLEVLRDTARSSGRHGGRADVKIDSKAAAALQA